MQTFKDLFSTQASDYAKFRPHYPTELFHYLCTLPKHRNIAWDAGTGNGQAATGLTKYFKHVIATDPSEKQINQATPNENITYKVENAEAPSISEGTVDLIIVAQAFHWFDHAAFAKACARVAGPDCHLVVWCYANPSVNPIVDAAVSCLYEDVLGPYWEKERRLVEEGYALISMPFKEILAPPMKLEVAWTLEQFLGYLKTWSALQKYLKTEDPKIIEEGFEKIAQSWSEERDLKVSWRLGMRVWKVR